MGIYIYKRTSEVLNVHTPEGDILKVNVYRFAFKPYWDEWDMSRYGPASEYCDSQIKRLVGYYRRFRTTSQDRFNRMQTKGQIHQHVVVLGDDPKNNEGCEVHFEEKPSWIWYDSDRIGEVVGTLHKSGRKWTLKRVQKEDVA